MKSTDGGATWAISVLQGITLGSIAIDPQSTTTLYVAAADEGILKSTDGGAAWIQINEGLPLSAVSLAIDAAVPSTLYAGTGSGVFKSTSAGARWRSTGLTDTPVNSLAINATDASTLYSAVKLKADAFVAKLNATGSALVYSTYFGGRGEDYGYGMAVDSQGSVSITGITRSVDLPLANALQPARSNSWNVFLARFAPADLVARPRVIDASISGKKLIIFGENFSDGAVIELNGSSQKTNNDSASPTRTLIGAKAGKRIRRGQTVTIRVRNSDGALSEVFSFSRPLD